MGERDDELLDDPPEADYHRGRFAGYEHGSRMRRWILFVLFASIVATILVGRWWVNQPDEAIRVPSPQYSVADGDEVRPDELVWNQGAARLGLSREPPGVAQIRLPDQVIRLAEGHDHAQIKVNVQNGKTVKLEVVVGAIEQTPSARTGQSD